MSSLKTTNQIQELVLSNLQTILYAGVPAGEPGDFFNMILIKFNKTESQRAAVRGYTRERNNHYEDKATDFTETFLKNVFGEPDNINVKSKTKGEKSRTAYHKWKWSVDREKLKELFSSQNLEEFAQGDSDKERLHFFAVAMTEDQKGSAYRVKTSNGNFDYPFYGIFKKFTVADGTQKVKYPVPEIFFDVWSSKKLSAEHQMQYPNEKEVYRPYNDHEFTQKLQRQRKKEAARKKRAAERAAGRAGGGGGGGGGGSDDDDGGMSPDEDAPPPLTGSVVADHVFNEDAKKRIGIFFKAINKRKKGGIRLVAEEDEEIEYNPEEDAVKVFREGFAKPYLDKYGVLRKPYYTTPVYDVI
jgi:hypothetical protein